MTIGEARPVNVDLPDLSPKDAPLPTGSFTLASWTCGTCCLLVITLSVVDFTERSMFAAVVDTGLLPKVENWDTPFPNILEPAVLEVLWFA